MSLSILFDKAVCNWDWQTHGIKKPKEILIVLVIGCALFVTATIHNSIENTMVNFLAMFLISILFALRKSSAIHNKKSIQGVIQ